MITPQYLPYPCKFDEREQSWVWEYRTEDNEVHEMYMDKGEAIKFRVRGEVFHDTTPIPDSNPSGGNKGDSQGGAPQPGTSKTTSVSTPTSAGGADIGTPQKMPYSITVCQNYKILFKDT